MVEKKGFVAKVAPPRPAEEETPLVVGSEGAPAFPGLEFEQAPSEEVQEPEPGEFMVGPTITFEGVEQPLHQPTAIAHDEHVHLPDHVREEILAGRKAMGQHEAKHGLEMSLGAKLSAQNHARTRPKLDEGLNEPLTPSQQKFADGDNPELRFGRGSVTTKVTRKSNYAEGEED